MPEQDTPVAVEEEGQVDGQPEGTPDTEETEVEALKAALESKEEHIAELESRVAEMEQRAQEQEAQLQEAEGHLAAAQEQLTQAVERYRSVLLASAPEMPEGLVQGDTVEEVDASFAQAKELVQSIRDRVEASTARERVPAGSPTRTGLDYSSLSPREKIAYALTRR